MLERQLLPSGCEERPKRWTNCCECPSLNRNQSHCRKPVRVPVLRPAAARQVAVVVVVLQITKSNKMGLTDKNRHINRCMIVHLINDDIHIHTLPSPDEACCLILMYCYGNPHFGFQHSYKDYYSLLDSFFCCFT